MPAKKTKRQLADEAYLRTLQVDLEQGIADSAQDALRSTPPLKEGGITYSPFASLPEACPACGAIPYNGWTIWTPLRLHTPNAERPNFAWRIQCGQCAVILHTTEQVWDEARALRQAKHQQNVKETRPKRVKFDERGNKL